MTTTLAVLKSILFEERDPRETIHHLEKLANHPNTGAGEAAAARNRAEHMRKIHGITGELHNKEKKITR